VFFISYYNIHRPLNGFCFGLAPDGTIGHAAIVAAIGQTGVGMDKQFGFYANFLVNHFINQ
jgi:hypothetical protein